MSDKYGLTQTGYKTKPLAVMVEEVENALINSLGPLNLTPPSVFSVLINTFLTEVVKVDLKGEEIYNAMYPNTASGYSLDGIADYNGIKRLAATYSSVTIQVTAINYTLIPAGSEVLVENTNRIFILPTDIVVNNESCNRVELEVIDNSLVQYKVILNNIEYVYNLNNLDTVIDIAMGLKLAIDVNLDLKTQVQDGVLTITSVDNLNFFSCFTTEGTMINNCTSNVVVVAKETGNIAVPERSVTVIQTPIAGWLTVNNLNAGSNGRDLENDIEFRLRRRRSIQFSGSGTIESMKARLLNITGVTSVKILENNTELTNIDGLPPKSFEALVLGGSNFDIAHTIWNIKPAGIQSFGSTTISILDSNGDVQNINFSRSTKIFVFLKIVITVNNDFANSSIETIKQNIVSQILKIELGEMVIYQALFAGVFAVDGVINAAITIGGTLIESNVPVLMSANILVSPSQIVTTDNNKIIIEISP